MVKATFGSAGTDFRRETTGFLKEGVWLGLILSLFGYRYNGVTGLHRNILYGVFFLSL